jgi:hypothetical protein
MAHGSGARPAPRAGRSRSRDAAWRAVLAGLALAGALASCRTASRPDAAVPMTPAPTRPIADVLADHTPALMALPGVVGTCEGAMPDGRPCIVVMLARASREIERRLPSSLEGWPVRTEVTGEFRAMPKDGRAP